MRIENASATEIQILHLGLGKFHRAHQAVYFHELNAQAQHKMGIVAFSMRKADACNAMHAMNHRYPIIEYAKDNCAIKWIESIKASYFCGESFTTLIKYIAAKQIQIITLTITEKGYCLNTNGTLNLELVRGDILNPTQPKHAIGLLYLGLQKRKAQENKLQLSHALTILSCDNLRANSHKLKAALLAYGECIGDFETNNWIEESIAFPNTMVDRIVPAITKEKEIALQKKFAMPNTPLLITETYRAWVIEDNFKTERPPLEKVGVQFVRNITPYEEIKLRLLNASHSLIAYAGLAHGYIYVHEAIADKTILTAVHGLFHEVAPLLTVPENFNLDAYFKDVLKRFDNPYVPHQLCEIAQDGQQKLRERIYPSLRAAEMKNLPRGYLLATLAYWQRYCEMLEKPA